MTHSNTTRHRRGHFTLLEVLIAVAILGLSLAMVLSLLGGARTRVIRAEQKWGSAHLAANAAELYLLAGAKADVPNGLFPPHFAPHCDLKAAENLSEEQKAPIDSWVLGQYHIWVVGRSGENVVDLVVEKLVPQSELP